MTWALLRVMNYLVTGTVEATMAQVVRQALEREPILRARFSSRSIGVGVGTYFFITLALLLTPPLIKSSESKFFEVILGEKLT
jgi:hypothetical protein